MSSRSSPKSPKQVAMTRFDPTFPLLIVFAVVVIGIMYFIWTSDDIKTVTQETSVTTAVTLNASRGIITTVSQTAAAAAEVVFQVNNSQVKADSQVIATLEYADGSTGYPTMHIGDVVAGSFKILLRNAHASAALNGVAKIHYRIY